MSLIVALIIIIACVVIAVYHILSMDNGNTYFVGSVPSTSSDILDHIASGSSSYDQRIYQFDIRYLGGEYRACILKSPNYRSRPTDAHSTHRHYDGRHYVCWSTPVRTRSDMITIAKQWAECTQKYIEQGIRF